MLGVNNIVWMHTFMMDGRMVFGEVVTYIIDSSILEYFENCVGYFLLDPMMIHIPMLGSFPADGGGKVAFVCIIIGF